MVGPRMWLVPLVVGVLTLRAAGQRGPMHVPSLALEVDRAEMVVRGTIEEVVVEPVARGGTPWVALTVKVSETLKGAEVKAVTFGVEYGAGSFYEKARASGAEFLWLVGKNEKYAEHAAEVERRYPLVMVGQEMPLGKVPEDSTSPEFPKGYFTADLGIVYTAEEIMGAARAEGKREVKGKVEGVNVGVRSDLLAQAHKVGDGLTQYVVMPRDERLEALAKRMIDKPETFGAPPDRANGPFAAGMTAAEIAKLKENVQVERDMVRAEGVKALAGFKSEGNVALLKPMLRNDTTMMRTYVSRDPPKRVVWYFVREAAYDVLKGWGVAVEEPVMEVEEDGHLNGGGGRVLEAPRTGRE